MRDWYRDAPALSAKISKILDDIYREFGLKARLAGPLVGRYLRFTIAREARRLREGWTYEPPTFRETNQRVAAASAG